MRKLSVVGKKESERIHCRRRALERYGINLGPRTRSALIGQIQDRSAILLRRISIRQRAFAVRYEREWYPVVYDNQRKEIVTFLPQNYLDRYRSSLPQN